MDTSKYDVWNVLRGDQIIARVNEELVATWGNLVNRVLSMSSRTFDGKAPMPDDLTDGDKALIELTDATLDQVSTHIEKVELRAGLRTGMKAAGEVNAYLNEQEPWKVIKTDPGRAGTVLWVAIQAISGIRVALAPYLPFSTAVLGEMLGLEAEIETWSRPEVAGGTPLNDVKPLFIKLDPDVLDA